MRKRTHKFKVRLTEEELSDLNAKVKEAGISREQYCRNAIEVVKLAGPPNVDIRRFVSGLRRINTKLYNILRIAQNHGPLNVPDLRQTLSDLERVEGLMEDAYFPNS